MGTSNSKDLVIKLYPIQEEDIRCGDPAIAAFQETIDLYDTESKFKIGIVRRIYDNSITLDLCQTGFPYARRLPSSWAVKTRKNYRTLITDTKESNPYEGF